MLIQPDQGISARALANGLIAIGHALGLQCIPRWLRWRACWLAVPTLIVSAFTAAPVYAASESATAVLSAPAPVRDLRPVSLCGANAGQLAECARAWERMVVQGRAPQTLADTWNAAEFEGIVDGFYSAAGAASDRQWCPRVMESFDQLDRIIADQLIAASPSSMNTDDVRTYLTQLFRQLWPCPTGAPPAGAPR